MAQTKWFLVWFFIYLLNQNSGIFLRRKKHFSVQISKSNFDIDIDDFINEFVVPKTSYCLSFD